MTYFRRPPGRLKHLSCGRLLVSRSVILVDRLSPERLDQLLAGWVRLLANWSVTPADAYPVLDRLVSAYSEPHRYYHTLEHLAEMFKVAGKLADAATDPAAVQLAIWFHDAVYDSRATDNEERSAALADE